MKVFYKSIVDEINDLVHKFTVDHGFSPSHLELTKDEWNRFRNEPPRAGIWIPPEAPNGLKICGLSTEIKE